jgi:hypothetical protein
MNGLNQETFTVVSDAAGRGGLSRFARIWADFVCWLIGHSLSEPQQGVYTNKEYRDGRTYRTRYCFRCYMWGFAKGDIYVPPS